MKIRNCGNGIFEINTEGRVLEALVDFKEKHPTLKLSSIVLDENQRLVLITKSDEQLCKRKD
jgi:hypothetical protein